MFYTNEIALTYDDVLIVPNYSEILPTEAELKTRFSRNIELNIPVVSSAMDTVTESRTAIAMALEGGIGVIHKNLPLEKQADEVQKVKSHQTDFENFPNATLDKNKKLRVAAACGVGPKEIQRAEALIKAGVDAIIVDTAHGHSKGVIDMVQAVKKLSNDIDVIAGNVGTSAGCEALIKAGADGIKVGIGPGSICTTRVVAGIGVPQMQAIFDCKEVCEKNKIPYIADGGIKYSGDIVKALAGGASTVMIGSLFAGCDETPGEKIEFQGRLYKSYRGMGSLGAMEKGSKDRYGQGAVDEVSKLVPEGIEGQVPYRGALATTLYQLLGGIRSGMGYVGAKTLKDLKERARFIKISSASLQESHPHDVQITKEAPNYR